MRKLTVAIGPHPAIARDKATGEQLADAEGNPIPLFADQRGIYIDGQCNAYVRIDPTGRKRYRINFCRFQPESIAAEITQQASKLLYGDDSAESSMPAPPEFYDGLEDEEDEDE